MDEGKRIVIDKDELSAIIHDRTKMPKYAKIIMLGSAIALFIAIFIIVWSHNFSVKISSVVGSIIGFTIFGVMYYLFNNVIVEDLHYGIPTEITLYDDRLEFVSVKGLRITVKYENIGLIRTARAIGEREVKYAHLMYYNENLGKCVAMWIPFSVGDAIVERYRKWVSRENRPSCVIYDERSVNPAEEMRYLTKLEKSPFCKRRRRR